MIESWESTKMGLDALMLKKKHEKNPAQAWNTVLDLGSLRLPFLKA